MIQALLTVSVKTNYDIFADGEQMNVVCLVLVILGRAVPAYDKQNVG
jgi:hypothetical protein